MEEPNFPPEVPSIDDSIRVTVVTDDLPSDYKFFMEESHVTSRLFAIDYNNRTYIEIHLTGETIRQVIFIPESGNWWTSSFHGKRATLEIKKILD